MKVKPLHSKLLVKVDKEVKQKTTAGGIYIPENVNVASSQKTGIVVELGHDEYLREHIKVGDKLLMPIYGGLIVDIDGEEHLIIDFQEVLAVLEKESCLTLI